jgi:hypothetical protein
LVDRVDPRAAPIDSSAQLIVFGAGFDSETSIFVGGEPCLDVDITSPQQAICTLPAGTPGLVDIRASRTDHATATLLEMSNPKGAVPGGVRCQVEFAALKVLPVKDGKHK